MPLIILLSLLYVDSFALVASDIDPSTAQSDVSIIIVALLSFVIALFGYKKLLSFLGR